MTLQKLLLCLLLVVAPPCLSGQGETQELTHEQQQYLKVWRELANAGGVTMGPTTAPLPNSEIQIPDGYCFLSPALTKKVLQHWGNVPSSTYGGGVAPASFVEFPPAWLVTFQFNDVGYVKDDDDLDADEILEGLRESQKEGNKERKAQGKEGLILTGWQSKPHYDSKTHNLEWGIKLKGENSEGEDINYNVKLLGREGFMSVSLLCSPGDLESTLPTLRTLIGGFAFKTGSRYADYKKGDKIAEYGLLGLIGGGGLLAGAKLGLFGKLWKFVGKLWYLVVAAIAGVLRFVKKLFGFGGSSGRPETSGASASGRRVVRQAQASQPASEHGDDDAEDENFDDDRDDRR